MTIAIEKWQDPDSAVRSERWWKPGPLKVEEGRLVHDYRAWWRHPTFTGPAPGMLEGFLALADAPDQEIAVYAGERGFLDLCQHQLPTETGSVGPIVFPSHPRSVGLPPYLALTGANHFPVEGDCRVPPERYEPTATWRYWSSQAIGVASVGLSLANKRAVDARDRARLYERAPWTPPEEDWEREERLGRLANAPVHSQEELRLIVEDALAFWLHMSRMSLRLHWSPRRGPDTYFTGGLFAALGVQLLMTITGRPGFALCAGCGMPHVPSRPNSGHRSFCTACRSKGVPGKLAAKRYAESKLRSRNEGTGR